MELGQIQGGDELEKFLADLDEKDNAEGANATNFVSRQKRAVKPAAEGIARVADGATVVGAEQATTHKNTKVEPLPR